MRSRTFLPTVTAAVALLLLLPGIATAQDAEPLPGDATTGPSQDPGSGGGLSVVDVRVGTHDGFDRVTFESAGEGEFGWLVQYEEEPVSDGSGEPIEFDGSVALRVVLTGAALPPDATAEPFLDDVAGPDGGVLNEVVNDTIFEGHHTFVLALDEQVPYRIGRLDDPARVVVDLVHPDEAPTDDETPAPTDDEAPPEGPVDAGLGGGGSSALPWAITGGLLVLAGLGLLAARRRSTA